MCRWGRCHLVQQKTLIAFCLHPPHHEKVWQHHGAHLALALSCAGRVHSLHSLRRGAGRERSLRSRSGEVRVKCSHCTHSGEVQVECTPCALTLERCRSSAHLAHSLWRGGRVHSLHLLWVVQVECTPCSGWETPTWSTADFGCVWTFRREVYGLFCRLFQCTPMAINLPYRSTECSNAAEICSNCHNPRCACFWVSRHPPASQQRVALFLLPVAGKQFLYGDLEKTSKVSSKY